MPAVSELVKDVRRFLGSRSVLPKALQQFIIGKSPGNGILEETMEKGRALPHSALRVLSLRLIRAWAPRWGLVILTRRLRTVLSGRLIMIRHEC